MSRLGNECSMNQGPKSSFAQFQCNLESYVLILSLAEELAFSTGWEDVNVKEEVNIQEVTSRAISFSPLALLT